MDGVEWETLALVAKGEISLIEGIAIIATWKYSWSVIRSTLTVSGFNILSKELIVKYITTIDENVPEDEEMTFIQQLNPTENHITLANLYVDFSGTFTALLYTGAASFYVTNNNLNATRASSFCGVLALCPDPSVDYSGLDFIFGNKITPSIFYIFENMVRIIVMSSIGRIASEMFN